MVTLCHTRPRLHEGKLRRGSTSFIIILFLTSAGVIEGFFYIPGCIRVIIAGAVHFYPHTKKSRLSAIQCDTIYSESFPVFNYQPLNS